MLDQEFIEVNGKKVDLRRGGSGEPFVYFHSAMGEVWADAFFSPLVEKFDVIVPAHPGFAESSGLEEIDDIEDLAFHYSDLLDVLGLRRAHFAGASLGGWIAAEVATRWPDRAKSLTLIDAVGIWVDEVPLAPIWGPVREELVDILFTDRSHPIAQLMISFDLEELPPDDMILQFYGQQTATAKIGWDPYLHNPKLARRLSRISCPTLVLWGERDRLAPPAYGKKYAELIPGARFETIPDAGHLGVVEHPEKVAEALSKFLA